MRLVLYDTPMASTPPSALAIATMGTASAFGSIWMLLQSKVWSSFLLMISSVVMFQRDNGYTNILSVSQNSLPNSTPNCLFKEDSSELLVYYCLYRLSFCHSCLVCFIIIITRTPCPSTLPWDVVLHRIDVYTLLSVSGADLTAKIMFFLVNKVHITQNNAHDYTKKWYNRQFFA